MSLLDPIEYRILTNLQAALLGVSMASGYHHDLRVVKLDPNHSVEELLTPDGPRPFAYIQPTSERWSIVSMPNGLQIEWPITIHWVHDTDQTDDNSRAKLFFEGCADIERAVTRDLSRGGLAVDTRVVTRVYTPVDGAQVWARMDLLVRVRRTYGAPNG